MVLQIYSFGGTRNLSRTMYEKILEKRTIYSFGDDSKKRVSGQKKGIKGLFHISLGLKYLKL